MVYLRYLLVILFIQTLLAAQERYPTISGKVLNKETGEPLVNCNVSLNKNNYNTATNKNGIFSLPVPVGEYTITFSFIGYVSQTKEISLSSKTKIYTLNINLEPTTLLGKEITVAAEKEEPATVVQKIKAKDIIKMPNIYSDVLRSVQILSGVASNNELSSGYNVRGGTFDENLIYLNGYEIYRPFLLRQGAEENQSLINPEMVSDLKFFNGAFPAKYGDKMSSTLEVQYLAESCDRIHGTIRADLLSMGAFLKGSLQKFNWKAGFRLAYPTMFTSKFQTRGDYKPSFSDVQFLGSYSFSATDRFELFFLYAQNKYDLSPKEWLGQFQSSAVEIRQISIFEDGEKYYSFNTNLAALRYIKTFSDSSSFNVSLARYYSKENETSNVTGDLYYSPDANHPDSEREYLFKRNENIDNKATLSSICLQTGFEKFLQAHSVSSGLEIKIVELTSIKDEFYVEEGDHAIQTIPLIQKENSTYKLNSVSSFLEGSLALSKKFKTTIGLRYLYNGFTEENLFSPRFNFSFTPSEENQFSFGGGVYYQPPFFAELTSSILNAGELKSQRAIHLKLGWQHQLKEKIKMNWEFYYKKLNNIIPFYYDDLRTVYVNGNVNEGYSYGFDVMFQGQISDGIDSWLGYGYLNSKEREANSGKPWHRRLLDQTHTLQIFLQDRFRKHQNWQSHLRILCGSGFLYTPRVLVKNQETQAFDVAVDLDNPREYFLYLRADMGLSATFNVTDNSKLMFVVEVLNVFNHNNIAGYEFLRVFNDVDGLVHIPKILSKRFLNIKVEFNF